MQHKGYFFIFIFVIESAEISEQFSLYLEGTKLSTSSITIQTTPQTVSNPLEPYSTLTHFKIIIQ